MFRRFSCAATLLANAPDKPVCRGTCTWYRRASLALAGDTRALGLLVDAVRSEGYSHCLRYTSH